MKSLKSLIWINDRIKNCHCDPSLLKNHRSVDKIVSQIIRTAGLEIVGKASHQFDRGYTCVWLLKQSHLSVHSWPEYNFVTLNIEICNFKGDDARKAEKLHAGLIRLFKPRHSHPKKSTMNLAKT